jgi:hypothetical protein
MKQFNNNVARLCAAASLAVSGFAIVGCQDELDRDASAGLQSGDTALALPAASSSGAIDAQGRTHSQSPSTSGPRLGGVGTVPGKAPSSSEAGAAARVSGGGGTAAGTGTGVGGNVNADVNVDARAGTVGVGGTGAIGGGTTVIDSDDGLIGDRDIGDRAIERGIIRRAPAANNVGADQTDDHSRADTNDNTVTRRNARRGDQVNTTDPNSATDDDRNVSDTNRVGSSRDRVRSGDPGETLTGTPGETETSIDDAAAADTRDRSQPDAAGPGVNRGGPGTAGDPRDTTDGRAEPDRRTDDNTTDDNSDRRTDETTTESRTVRESQSQSDNDNTGSNNSGANQQETAPKQQGQNQSGGDSNVSGSGSGGTGVGR